MAVRISQARESSDNPKLNAFCRVAPSVRLSVFAILAACVFFFANTFKVRSCSGVHARRFDAFLAIQITPVFRKAGLITESFDNEKSCGVCSLNANWRRNIELCRDGITPSPPRNAGSLC